MSTCDCKNPGWCEKYKRQMVGRMHELCQSSQEYRDAFDRAFLAEKPAPTAEQPVILDAAGQPVKRCCGQPPAGPGLVRMAQAVLAAKERWEAAGKPLRSKRQAKKLHREHCQPCPHYVQKTDSCGLCGCPLLAARTFAQIVVGKLALQLPGKLYMATEGCPKVPPEFQPDE